MTEPLNPTRRGQSGGLTCLRLPGSTQSRSVRPRHGPSCNQPSCRALRQSRLFQTGTRRHYSSIVRSLHAIPRLIFPRNDRARFKPTRGKSRRALQPAAMCLQHIL